MKLWDAALRYNPTDPKGLWRSNRAWALGIGGRFREAKAQADELFPFRKADPGFLYDYASLCSSGGGLDETVLSNVKVALSHDWICSDLEFLKPITLQTVKTDPNLAPLRQTYPTEFADLMKIKWKWDIDWGWNVFDDQICLHNQSVFPLTNVKLDVTVKSTGYATWGPRRFEAPRIRPGQVFRWKVDIPTQGDDVKGSASLVADQDN